MVEILTYLRVQNIEYYLPFVFMGTLMFSVGLFSYSLSSLIYDYIEKFLEKVVNAYRKHKPRKSKLSPKLTEILKARHQVNPSTSRKIIQYINWLIPEVILTSAKTLIILSVLGVIGFIVGSIWLNNVGAAIVICFLLILLPGKYLSRADIRKQERYAEQLSPAIRTFIVSLEQKGNVRIALNEIACKHPEPTKSLFQKALWRLDSGIQPSEALTIITREINLSHSKLFVQLILEAYNHGDSIIPQFSRLAGQVDTMHKLRIKNRELTEPGRWQNVFIHLLLLGIALMLLRLLPESEKYLTQEPIGRLIVLLSFISVLVGVIFDRIMSRVDV